MTRVRAVALLMTMTSLAVPDAWAQVSGAPVPTLAEGTRVRVLAVHRRDAITGVVVSHSADTLVVKSDRDTGTVALAGAQVSRVEVSRGRRTQKLRGAGIGFLSGAAIGALLGYATYEKPSCSGAVYFCDFGPEFDAAVGASLLGVVGALVGTMVGSREREQWRPASGSLGRDARLGIAPARGGVALSASLTF